MSDSDNNLEKKKLMRWLVYYPMLGMGAIVVLIFFMITFPLFVLTTAISASITTTRLSCAYVKNKLATRKSSTHHETEQHNEPASRVG